MSWTPASWVNNIILGGSLARIAIYSELIFRHLGNGIVSGGECGLDCLKQDV